MRCTSCTFWGCWIDCASGTSKWLRFWDVEETVLPESSKRLRLWDVEVTMLFGELRRSCASWIFEGAALLDELWSWLTSFNKVPSCERVARFKGCASRELWKSCAFRELWRSCVLYELRFQEVMKELCFVRAVLSGSYEGAVESTPPLLLPFFWWLKERRLRILVKWLY